MAEDALRYDRMVEHALRGVVRSALAEVVKSGLPGDHHFYITFRTRAPGVELPPHLLERYPQEMTIVLQYQYWNLVCEESRFEVTLSFNDVRHRLVVPFAAVTSFADPSVKFGLQFQYAEDESPDGGAPPAGPTEEGGAPGQVVSLDQFRRKK